MNAHTTNVNMTIQNVIARDNNIKHDYTIIRIIIILYRSLRLLATGRSCSHPISGVRTNCPISPFTNPIIHTPCMCMEQSDSTVSNYTGVHQLPRQH